jgi:hypothetical protein
MILGSVGTYLQVHTALQPRRQNRHVSEENIVWDITSFSLFKYTDVSEVCTASVISLMIEAVRKKRWSISAKLHGTV